MLAGISLKFQNLQIIYPYIYDFFYEREVQATTSTPALTVVVPEAKGTDQPFSKKFKGGEQASSSGGANLNIQQGEGSIQRQGDGHRKGKQVATSAPPKMNLSKEAGGTKLMADAFKGGMQLDLPPEDDDVNDRVRGIYGEDLSEDDMLSEEMMEMQPQENIYKVGLVKCSVAESQESW